jgi:KUP system potassium uptake protein
VTGKIPGESPRLHRGSALPILRAMGSSTSLVREATTPTKHTGSGALRLGLGALGVVYGDIGTSPLYAIKECVISPHGVDPTRANVLGVLSLITWSLLLVVVLKYLTFIMRADNRGEGGILALLALILPREKVKTRATGALLLLGLFGAGLLYGDGMITPAISVLSAVEGLSVATTALKPIVVPLTVAIIAALFLVQRLGTGRVGKVFGGVMLLYFVSIAALGLPAILRTPSVLEALSPHHAVRFFLHNGLHGFLLLGAVVLAVTGGEALYADMGHFGRRPIQKAWYTVVLPALLINYFGQGALLLERGAAVAKNPFFALAGGWLLYPMVVLATAAAVIASQALISGAFSLTQQAVQLGYWPRVRIIHTSETEAGQIYIPEINWLLMIMCIALVLGFGSSSRLAAAYGIAVTGTMAITSMLFHRVARERWGWSATRTNLLVGLFLFVDLAFFSANVAKFVHGGWFPVAVAAGMFTLMTTWAVGRRLLADRFAGGLPLRDFLADPMTLRAPRVPGTAVFMTSVVDGTPNVLLHHWKHNKVLHDQVILLSVITERVPVVDREERVELEDLGSGFWKLVARYGFMEDPDIPALLRSCQKAGGPRFRAAETSYYLGRETLLTSGKAPMMRWRKRVFAFQSRNARAATAFFKLPPNRVVELGAQIEL